jgi:hypothetical protein
MINLSTQQTWNFVFPSPSPRELCPGLNPVHLARAIDFSFEKFRSEDQRMNDQNSIRARLL